MIIMKNKSLIAIIFTSIIIFLGLLFSVYKIIIKESETFYNSGYVSLSDLESSDKVYFAQGTTYKRNYSQDIVFKDIENVKRNISKYSYVFYDDKSIAFFNDGVLMDLDSVANSFIPYYNIKSNYLISYTADKYLINAQDKDIILNNFIGKINDNKYIVAGNNLKLKVSSSDEFINGYYFELNFGEGNIVKIDNNQISLETISDESYILVGTDIKIDLSDKTISYLDEVKVNLSEIIINNDENIDILYEEDDYTSKEDKNSEKTEDTVIVDTGDNYQIQTVVEKTYHTETVTDYKTLPYVEILSSETNSHKISLDFKVNDTSNLLSGDILVRCMNLSNGNIIENSYSNYSGLIEYNCDSLTSDSNYLVTISGSYIRNNNVYNDYIMFQKTFSTKDIGVDLTKDYISSTEIAYNINFNNNATFTSATVNLYDNSNNLVDSYAFTNDLQTLNVIFTNLNSNTTYTAKVENISYGNVIYNNGSAYENRQTTLKYNPFKDAGIVASPNAVINKKEGVVTFDIGLIADNDASIESISYYIYDINDNLVKTIKKDNQNAIDVPIEQELSTYETYYYNAIITLYDNEKTIEYKTTNSNNFNLGSKAYPVMYFDTKELTANTVQGTFTITDADNALDLTKDIYVIYTDSLGNSNTKMLEYTSCADNESSTTKCVSLYLNDLNSDDIYTLNLIGYVDVNDEQVAADYMQIGAIKINTLQADVVLTDMSAANLEETEALAKFFEIYVHFSLDSSTSETVKNNMGGFDIVLYEGFDNSGSYLKSIHVSDDIVENYFNNTKTLTLDDFGLSLEDLQYLHLTDGGIASKYSIRLTNGVSGSDYVEFKPNVLNFEINEILLNLTSSNATIEVEPILNNSLSDYYDSQLNNDTIIGLSVIPNFENKKYATAINFVITDVISGETLDVSKQIQLNDNNVIPNYDFMFADYELFKRGRVYKVSYTIDLDINNDGITDIIYPFLATNSSTPNPVVSEEIIVPKQMPSMILFPWTSDDNSITFKYHITDIDNTLSSNVSIYASDDNHLANNQTAICSNSVGVTNYTSLYDCMQINDLNAGEVYNIYLRPVLLETENAISEKLDIYDFTFEGISSIENVNYLLVTDEDNKPLYNNILALKIASNDNSSINRIAYYTLEFSINNGAKSFKIDNINNSITINPSSYNMINYYENGVSKSEWKSTKTNNDNLGKVAYVVVNDDETILYLDYSKLYTSKTFASAMQNFKDNDITVSLSATYDTGKIAYYASATGLRYAFAVYGTDEYVYNGVNYQNYYLNLYGNNSAYLSFSPNALATSYAYWAEQGGFVDDTVGIDNNLTGGRIYLLNTAYSNLTLSQERNYINLDYTVNSNGINVSFGSGANKMTLPVVMKLLDKKQVNGSAEFAFNKIIPSMNITNSVPTVNGVKLDLQLIGITDDDIKTENGNKYLYLEVYSQSDNLVKTIKINKEHLNGLTGSIKNNSYLIPTDDDYKVDVNAISNFSDYNYDYRTGEITFNEDVADNTSININYSIILDNLIMNNDYYLKAYMYINNEKTYLSHSNSTYSEFIYDFTTKNYGNINISNAKYDVISDIDYNTRLLDTQYSIDSIIGIDNITYEICNDDGICAKVNNPSNCDYNYNKIGDTCFDNDYNANVKHDISLTDDLDFVFNDSYRLQISIDVTENDEQHTYIIYNTKHIVRLLNEPTLTVTKKSNYSSELGYYLSFDIYFEDIDRVITSPEGSNGKGIYSVYLASGAAKNLVSGTERLLNVTNSASDVVQTVTFDHLEPSSEYYLIVEYNTYTNNLGTNAQHSYSIPYLIYTLDDNGISIGKMEYQALKNKTILRFGYATNITKDYIIENDNLVANPNQIAYVAGILYRITRTSGDNTFQINGTLFFDNDNPIEHINDGSSTSTIGEDYYQITINGTSYPVIAGYNITFAFYLGGSITRDLNTESLCKADSESNYWNQTESECYTLSESTYNAYTTYEGADS